MTARSLLCASCGRPFEPVAAMRAPVRRYADKGCAVGPVRLRRVKQISLARPMPYPTLIKPIGFTI